MIQLISYICAALLTVPFVMELRYFMQMFQQNSYKPDRYLRWLDSNRAIRFTLQSKVKFAMTRRMVRLMVACLLVYALVCCLAGVIGAVICIAFCPFLLLLGNLLCTPVEKALVRYYIRDAKRILSEHKGLVIVGVTGSFGKTSTKNFLYRILSEKYNTLITPGNFNTTLGVVRTIREQLQPQHQVFIVEMGAKQVGDIKEICDLVNPSIGVVTAVGPMHLETFHSFENIQKTKFELIDSLPSDGLGVINADSPGIASYGAVRTDCKIERYSLSDVKDLEYSPSGTAFTYMGERFHTQLLGEGNILNILGALRVATALGVGVERQKVAVSKLQSVEHRLSMRRAGGLVILDDAYNSNPAGAAMALSVLGRMQTSGRRIVVTPGFVELGEAQQQECSTLGSRAAQCADYLVIVNLYNRQAILDGALQAGMPQEHIILADNLAQAAAWVNANAQSGDIVLYENDLPDTFR